MSRTSVRSYLRMPVKSAWPGRAAVTFSPAGSPKAAMRSPQFWKSRLTTCSVMGPPIVSLKRTPERTLTLSFSIFMRPPRP